MRRYEFSKKKSCNRVNNSYYLIKYKLTVVFFN